MSLKSKVVKLLKRTGLLESDRYVIMCNQRSGSNMLTGMLIQHPDVDFFGQVFKDNPAFRKMISGYDVPEFQGYLFDDKTESRERFDYLENQSRERESRNTADFTEAYFTARDKGTDARCIGIKFHGGTLYRDEIESIFLNGDYKVIIQHRRNLLAAAISWYQAREADQWRRLNGEKVISPEIEMDIDTLQWFIQNCRKDVALWKRLVNEKNIDYLELIYEDLTDPDFNFSEIWDYLGVKDLGTFQAPTKKLIKSYNHITNIDEIRRELESPSNGFLPT